jgi:hypothetical protein
MASKASTKAPKKPKVPASKVAKAKSAPTADKPKAKAASATVATPSRTPAATRPAAPPKPVIIPRGMAAVDDDDVLMAHGGGSHGYGRCGGRLLGSRLEQTLCDRLSNAGVAHSHSPRHFEVRVTDNQVAAYAPMLVLRGRGREGKSVVVEACEDATSPILKKISAFRAQYGQEFYVILVAPDEVLDDAPVSAYDESCSATSMSTLISRLAE